MARIAPISGFPEWSPAQRAVEQQVLDELRRVFELHGFASIETRAVEPVEQLLRKGEIDKEVYGVRRLAADAGVRRRPARPALRPHRAVRAVRPRERRHPAVPVPPLPGAEGLARGAAAGGSLPRVRAGRHRRRRPRHPAVRLRGRAAPGDGRGVRRAAPARPARDGHPGQQPTAGRGLLPRASVSTTPPPCCAPSTSSTRSGRTACVATSPPSAPPTRRCPPASRSPRSVRPEPVSSTTCAPWGPRTSCSTRVSTSSRR